MTKRSGSRAPVNPKTKAQRVTRIQELSERRSVREAEAIALLDERDRIIVALKDEDGLSFREIGTILGQTTQNAHLAYHRGKGLLAPPSSELDAASTTA